MSLSITRYRTILSLVVLVLVALIPRCLIATSPITTQLQKTLPDDAYYYFLTADNLVHGQGPSVDGLHDNNGWHPLWLLLNLPIFALPIEPDIAVRLTLLLGAILDSTVVVILFVMLRQYVSYSGAIVGALLYALSSTPVFQSVNGLETGLTAAMIAAAWSLTLLLLGRPGRPLAILWGIVFGLCFLARTDAIFYLLLLGVYVLNRLPATFRWQYVAFGAFFAAVIVSPWLIWNLSAFGSLIQSSGVAVPETIWARFAINSPGEPIWHLSLKVFLLPSPWFRGDYFAVTPLIGFFLWPAAIIALWNSRSTPHRKALVTVAFLLLGGTLILIIVHVMIRWYPRPWYFIAGAQSLSIGCALLWDSIRHPQVRLIVATVSLMLLIAIGKGAWNVGYYPWQNRQFAASAWLRANTEPDAIVASMNSGIMGYYSGRTVINMDGVVNPAALKAIRAKQMIAYMREAGVDYFVDFDYALHSEYGPFMGPDYESALEEIALIGDLYPDLGRMRVYRLVR